jgi:hypothetical protein
MTLERTGTNRQLASTYAVWKKNLAARIVDPHRFGPPILISATEQYCDAERRIIIYGKETFGWEWNRHLKDCYPEYPNDWPYQDINTLADFIRYKLAVEALSWGYSEFSFSKYQPITRRSPFWQAVRQIQAWHEVGVLHSNLVHSDMASEDRSILNVEAKIRNNFIDIQRTVFQSELRILQPHLCIFFTGPDYDELIKSTFQDIKFQPIGTVPERELAALHHPKLPLAFRTYHPNYLWQSRKSHYIDLIRSLAGL